MSFYIVICSSLGMSAFRGIVEKIKEVNEICRFFSGGRWDWIWAPFLSGFWDDFGSSWAPKSEKRRSRNSNEKSLNKKSRDSFRAGPGRAGGGGALKQSSFHPEDHDKGP